MTHSAAWWAETAQFFAYLRGRGWRFCLMRQGQHLVSLHWVGTMRGANDNGAAS